MAEPEDKPKFPAGLRVLVVDDDPLCLRIVDKMLRRCQYEGAMARRNDFARDFACDPTRGTRRGGDPLAPPLDMQRGASRLSASPRVLSTAFSDRVFCRAPRIARFSGLSLTTNNPFPLRTPVTTFMRGAEALKTLRERRDDFDIVLSDVHMPDMDGFKLLEHIALELDVPVMSAYPAPKSPLASRRVPGSPGETRSARPLSPSESR